MSARQATLQGIIALPEETAASKRKHAVFRSGAQPTHSARDVHEHEMGGRLPRSLKPQPDRIAALRQPCNPEALEHRDVK